MEKELSEMSLEELWKLFPIILKEHNKDYKRWYIEMEVKLINLCGKENVIRINHAGSSSVKGLISKPTVDILMEINREANLSDIIKLLTEDGWILMFSQEVPFLQEKLNNGYTNKGFAEKVYHLDIRYHGDWDELYFRDYLEQYKEVAIEYGDLKLSLLEEYRNNRDGYTEAKTEFVRKYTRKARKEYRDRYQPKL